MKKLTKLLSVFLIAGAVGTGAAGIAACSSKQPETPEHTHTAATEWQSDANGHWHNCTENDGAKLDEGAHVWDNDQDTTCNTCGYERTVTPPAPQGFVVPAGTDSLVIEGVTEEVTLSETVKSHTIDKTAIKVYLSAKGVKGTEVPAANYELELYLNGETKVTEWTGLKEDADYVVVAILKDAVDESGKAVELDGETTVTVNNALVSLALKAGTTTQVQGVDAMTSTWTFEATRANGDKEDIVAADVNIGTMDTNTVGENKTVEISLKANANVKGTVTYTITEDASKVAQAYALNFGYLTTAQETSIKNGEAVSLQDGRFVIQSTTSGEVASHGKEYNGKYFAKRLKVNGASANKSGCSRYIKVKADGAGTITVVAYNNSGAVGDGATRGVELYTTRTADPAGDTYAGKIGETVAVPSKDHATGTFTIPAAGEYYITCDNAMTFAYVQLDQLVSASEGSEVTLGGETVVSKIEVTKPSTVTNFKVGDAFTHEGYTVTATGVNNVTCVSAETDVTAQAEFVEPDMTTIGEKTVTVNYGGVSTTYKVIVETAVDGIYGATAAIDPSVSLQVSSADGKVTLTKESVVVALVGENAEATKTYTVSYNDVEITTGTEFAIGEYELVVTVTVMAGAQEDQIVCKVAVKVEQEAAAGATASFIVPDTAITDESKTIAAGGKIEDNTIFSLTTSADMNYNIGKDATSGVGNTAKAVTVTLQDGSSKTFKQGISTTVDTAGSATTSDIVLTAKTKTTVRVYVTFANNSYNSDRPATINYTISGGTAQTASIAKRTEVAVIEVTLEEGQTLTINATNTGTSAGRLWLFGAEGKAVA